MTSDVLVFFHINVVLQQEAKSEKVIVEHMPLMSVPGKQQTQLYTGIREWPGLKWMSKIIWINHPAMGTDICYWTRFLKSPSNLALNNSSDGVSTTPLDNLLQCLIIHSKEFFLISNLNLPSFSMRYFPLLLLHIIYLFTYL